MWIGSFFSCANDVWVLREVIGIDLGNAAFQFEDAGIAGFDADTPLEDYMPEDFINEPLDPNTRYFDDVTVIVGHIPTYTLPDAEKGKIYHGNGCILMDCGAAFGETLGCLCLETGKETYVS